MRKPKKTLRALALLMLIALVPVLSDAGTLVDQGAGSTGQQPWKVVQVSSYASVAPVGAVTAGAPTFSVSVSAVSAAAIGLATGTCYRISCSTTVAFRTGTGTPVALTTDMDIFGPAVEKVCLIGTATAFAFVTTAATGTCKGMLLP